ncbi:retrovirus-related Pol polyprotein from transposon 297 [Trichonephila clavipes]|nr:retrovirus-related Pol polyprotein from transposon 297 [Trichonephila clavipes]
MWAEVIPLNKSPAKVIADSLFDNYISRYGIPIKMISDNGPQFISDTFEHLINRLGIRHVKTAVYRPQANRIERVNRDFVQMIVNYVNDPHETWDQLLREFAYAIRMVVNETTEKPCRIIFRKEIDYPISEISDGIGRNRVCSRRILRIAN